MRHASTLALAGTIADRAERTFELLRYRLGGNRPSQTDPLAWSPGPIQGSGLELRPAETGISRCGSTAPDDAASKPPGYATYNRPEPSTRLQ